MNILERSFAQLGFSKNHYLIYSLLLKEGPLSLKEISLKTDIPRTSIYEHYPKLLYSGLISVSSKNGKKLFQAEKPEIVFEKIKEMNRTNINIEKLLSSKISRFSSMYKKHKADIDVRYLNGRTGIETVFKLILSYKANYNLCLGTQNKNESISKTPEYILDFIRQFKKKGIKTREILDDVRANREYRKLFAGRNQKIKLYPTLPRTNSSHIDKFIMKDTVVYIDFDKLTAVVINDEQLAENERLQFEIMWKGITNSGKN